MNSSQCLPSLRNRFHSPAVSRHALWLALAFLGCSESTVIAGPDTGGAPPLDLPTEASPRLDTPSYGARGTFDVGFRHYQHNASHRPEKLQLRVWYPAAKSNAENNIEYPVKFKNPDWKNFSPAVVYGHAILNADVAATQSAHPVVLFSHGYSLSSEFYSELLEHYASQGFIVIAPEHDEADWFAAAEALYPRPLDIQAALEFAESLAGEDSDFSDMIDLDRIAIVGHSFGGYTALAIGGARLHLDPFDQYCAALDADDPAAFVCAPFAGKASEIAQMAGLSEVPDSPWPAQSDKRVKAVVSLAGDAYMFGSAGLESLRVPLLAMGGTLDFGTPWELGARPSYEYAKSENKVLIGLEGGNHMLPATRCEFLPWSSQLVGFEYSIFCEDPVWDKQRSLDLICHYSTAFLKLVLSEEQEALEALNPQEFTPGVTVLSTY